MSKLHKVQIHGAIKHDLLELTLDHPKACFKDCWEIHVKESDTVVLFIQDIAYDGNVLLPVTVESSLDKNNYLQWKSNGGGVKSPVFEPTEQLKLYLHVSAATGAAQSKKSSPVIVIKTGRPDVGPV